MCKIPKENLIEADPLQIKELFNNILSNAHQSFQKKRGRIDIKVWLDMYKNFNVNFKDNGIGIRPEDLDKIFEPFFTTKVNGTGLGLVVCKQIVSLHNGKIELDSKAGRGTTILITLPSSHSSSR